MPETGDIELLAQFARENSEAAFAALVGRHANLVYSVALRRTGNPHAAEEITQAVFIILAKKARSLSRKTILSGWLHQTTRLTSANFLRTEIRRRNREQEAFMQSISDEPANDEAWQQIAPHLDEAISELREKDRDALVLRYFENKSLSEVGAALGLEERAAQKRVHRAVEKLRNYFSKRGVGLTTAITAGVISANSVQAAPVGLAKTISAVVIAKGAVASGSTLTNIKGALKLMAWTKMKTAIVAGAVVLLAATTISVAIFSVGSQDREARKILEQMSQKYALLSSYSSNVKAVEKIDEKTLTVSCAMRLGKTNLYYVEYEQHAPAFTNKGAIWSDGLGDYWKNEMTGTIFKQPISGPDENFSFISADFTEGATLIVPSMFFGFPAPTLWSSWKWLFDGTNWSSKARFSKESDEKVEGVDCYVFSSRMDDKMIEKITLWIGKQDFLLHKSQERLTDKLPEATDSEVKQLEIVGTPPLPIEKMKRRINEGRKKAMATMKPVTVIFSTDNKTGVKSMTIQPPNVIVFTQTYENVSVNQKFSASNFAP